MHIQFTFNLDRAISMSGKYCGKPIQNATHAVNLLTDAIPMTAVDREYIYNHRIARIECTGEQFARYLIARSAAGYLNSFRELLAREVVPAAIPPRIIFALMPAESGAGAGS